MQRVVKAIVRGIAFFLIRLEVVGDWPEKGPYIMATNHVSAYDSPIVFMVVPYEAAAFAGAKHRRNPIFGPLLSLGRPIWIKRGEVDREALRKALEKLEEGIPFGLAPEGTRSPDARMQRAKVGAAYLATRAGVPILPVGITGTENIKHNIKKLRRTPVRIVLGELFRLPEDGRVRGPKLREYTDLIMREIAALLPEEYRGVYAD
jgi:1-acyl-sn-glycerol-3-phosphate acyltransferase